MSTTTPEALTTRSSPTCVAASPSASVEPVGEVMEGIQTVGFGRKEIQKFAQFDQSLPVGTKLYAGAPPAHIPADAPVWNSIQIASWIGSQLMHEPAMFERSTVCKFVRSLGRHPTLLKHSPQPQAVDAVDEWEAFQVWRTRQQVIADNRAEGDDWIDAAKQVDGFIAGYRAALQASRQPQAQQCRGENTARAFIEWCKAQPEDRVPVSIDEALNEFEAALATKEPK